MMKDKKIFEELYKIKETFDEKPVDKKLLTMLFQSEGGAIYANDESKIAIGFYPNNGILSFVFFEIVEDDKLKYVERRGIFINDNTAQELKRAIDLCKTQTDFIKDDKPTVYHV